MLAAGSPAGEHLEASVPRVHPFHCRVAVQMQNTGMESVVIMKIMLNVRIMLDLKKTLPGGARPELLSAHIPHANFLSQWLNPAGWIWQVWPGSIVVVSPSSEIFGISYERSAAVGGFRPALHEGRDTIGPLGASKWMQNPRECF